MKNVLVTGGTGFIGANLVRRLLQNGHHVHLFIRENSKYWRIKDILDDLDIHKINMNNEETLTALIRDIKPEWIFHLATYGAYPAQQKITEIVQTNINSTINLIEACLETGFELFVNTGSSSEYGFKDYAPTEDALLEPNSAYAFSKASATLFCHYIAQRYKVYIPTLRLYSVYGPFEEPSRLIPTLIIKGLKNELPPLVNPDISRDFIFAEDVVDIYMKLTTCQLSEFGSIFNIGYGKKTTINEVVELTRSLLNITAKAQWGTMPDRDWDTSCWFSNNKKAVKDLNWQPRFSLKQGIQAFIEWLKNNDEMIKYYNNQVTRKTLN